LKIMIIFEIGCAKILGESRGLSRAKALAWAGLVLLRLGKPRKRRLILM
jgi:hypothetical protein